MTIINPPGSHRAGARNSVLLRRIIDHGVRDTLCEQVGRRNEIEQEVINRSLGRRQPDVYCWCQTEIVRGTFDRIARGLTESCGAPNCKEPE